MAARSSQDILIDLLNEVRDDVKELREDITVMKTQRQVMTWLAGVIGGAFAFIADHGLSFLSK
jgi:hypoxanthine-guanine phosphoribosyltransferase